MATTATDAATTAATTAAGTTAAPTATNGGETVNLTDLPDLSTAASVGESTSSTDTASATTTGSIFHLTGVPTIAGYGIPTQVVPWTAGAPYMQTSKLPEGTVFIIVGAVLGFLGMAVLAWRGMVAYSLHRSVKRAQMGMGGLGSKSGYGDSMVKLGKPTMMASSTQAMGSTLSLDRLSAPAGKLSRKHDRSGSGAGIPNQSAARNSSLFFSPTAGAGAHHHTSHSMGASANRSSAYLPAGYYASPSANAPASNNKHASVGGGGLAVDNTRASRLSSLNPNHPSNRGYSTAASDFDVSPPDTPSSLHPTGRPSTGGTLGAPPSRRGTSGYERVSHHASDSWGNLNIPGGAPAGQRAPSANLEDLFEHHGNGMRGH